MKKLLAAAALILAPATFAFAAPAAAQALPFEYGDLWDVSMIDVEDGASATYIDHLAGDWKKGQEFAKSQGWITGYHVLSNLYARNGEPDFYLVTIYSKFPTAAETAARDKAYDAFMKTTIRKQEEESGVRAKYRKLAGSMMLGELKLK